MSRPGPPRRPHGHHCPWRGSPHHGTHLPPPAKKAPPRTRTPLAPPRTIVYRLAEWYSRRAYGVVAEPAAAMAHNPRVLLSDARFERTVAGWNRLGRTLKALAVMASAATIGCSWCMDFGYWESTRQGVAPAKLRDVPRWRDSDVSTDLERQVMAYAEAATATPPAVTDEMVAALRRRLDDA